MKKLFALLAVALGVVACQKDQVDMGVNMGGEQEVMINVSLPAETRASSAQGFDLSSLASSDYQLRYILEIYQGENCLRQVKYSDDTSVIFPVRLAPGREYKFAVWADIVSQTNPAVSYYNAESLKSISINMDEWTPMNEARDAFYGKAELGEEDNLADLQTIELTRPFAKVRVVATDIDVVKKLGIEPDNATVKYTVALPTTFNAVTGEADTDNATSISPIDYAMSAYTEATGQLTVFADYIFVPENGTISFNLNVKDGAATIKENNFSTAIPVERNKVTSIVGDVLTEGGNVSVKIENELGEKVTINLVGTASDLQQAINAIEVGEEGNIQLGGDIDLNNLLSAGILSTRASANAGLVIPEGKSVVLDLNGFTISQSKACDASYSMIANNGNLTILGGGIVEFTNTAEGGGSTWGTYTIENRGEGVLTIDNATIRHNGCVDGDVNHDTNIAIQNYQGKVVVNNGTIASTQFRSLRDFTAGGEIIINGGTFLGQVWMQGLGNGSSSLTITGGSFSPVVGYDGSSVYITNGTNVVNVAISGGMFNTKVGCYDANKEGAKGCISGGSFTATAKENTAAALINDDYAWAEAEGLWTLARKADVAKIGDVGYTSLAKAVAAVEDGGTITLVADEVFTENNYYDNGGWKDGLGYSGDKSFTIDLNSKTIRQNGALNDYLIWIKNDGSKANTITLKNGTLDAGTTAYCAFATASSNKQKITINLEDINLVGNNSNGAVAKIRGGAELNVKSGTVITGKNNYVGIEAVGNNTVVNIYDNVNIYQNGTGSYVGGIVGASYNATMNIYGGYGKSAKCGIIVMSTGATINVSGGEWIANNDGTVANDNNAVLVSQNNRYETGWACKSILNVTGGTFKGGYNCYGMGPGVEPDDAQINIKGGNFNANPANYVVAGYEAVEENGAWSVGKPQALVEFEAAIAQGGNVTLTKDITLLEPVRIEGKKVVLDLNGKTVTAPLFSAFEVKSGAELTIKNGKVVAYESTVRAIGGKATIESGEYTSTGTALDSPATYRYSLDCREGGELIINGGTFKSNNGMINVGSTVTINGGKFENVVEKSMTRHFAYVSAPLTINDGEFYGKANSSAGGCFFCGAAAGGDIQVNGGKFTSLWTSGSVNRIFEYYYGGTINVTGGMFNTNGGIATFVTENTDEATKAAYPYVAK